MNRLPITLLTGFLGSGKTTVLNTLLRSPAFARTVVIVNEFGDVGLDHEFVVSTTEMMVLLQSGCMCCTLRGDLLDTLIELKEGLDGGLFTFDRVVIETSGLADPAPILHTLLTSVDLSERFFVDGVVTTVDAAAGLPARDEAHRQVALADLVLLTKTDLVPDESIKERIAAFAPATTVIEVVHGAVAPDLLMDLGHFNDRMKAAEAEKWVATPSGHLDNIRTISWVFDQPLSGTVFDIWMDMLMAQRGEDVLRLKGLVHVRDVPFPFVVHGVQHIFHPPVPLRDWHGDNRQTKLVMIVRDFTDAALDDLFNALNILPATEHVLPGGFLTAEVA